MLETLNALAGLFAFLEKTDDYEKWNRWGKKGQKTRKGHFQRFLKSRNNLYLPQIERIVSKVAEVAVVSSDGAWRPYIT
jgi:hypothetical protein